MSQPNLALRDFLQGEQPVTAKDLWLRIGIARGWSPWPDLPATRDDLDAALAVLERDGFAYAEGGSWRLKYPQPAVKEPGEQKELFA